jgi:hypothetical protein
MLMVIYTGATVDACQNKSRSGEDLIWDDRLTKGYLLYTEVYGKFMNRSEDEGVWLSV